MNAENRQQMIKELQIKHMIAFNEAQTLETESVRNYDKAIEQSRRSSEAYKEAEHIQRKINHLRLAKWKGWFTRNQGK